MMAMFAHQKTAKAASCASGARPLKMTLKRVGDHVPGRVGVAEAGEPGGLGQQLGRDHAADEQQDGQRVARQRQPRRPEHQAPRQGPADAEQHAQRQEVLSRAAGGATASHRPAS